MSASLRTSHHAPLDGGACDPRSRLRVPSNATARPCGGARALRSGPVPGARARAREPPRRGDEGVTLTEVAQQVGLSPSTAHRLLTTLEQERYVHFDASGGYGPSACRPSSPAAPSSRRAASWRRAPPHAGPDGGQRGDGEPRRGGPVRGRLPVAGRVPADDASLRATRRPGPAALLQRRQGAAVGDAGRRARQGAAPSRPAAGDGEDHQHHRRAARRTSHAARERGYALDDEEHAVGLRCIAAVVFDEHAQAIAAVSLSGPMARIPDERIPILGDMVWQKAAIITAQLGGMVPSRGVHS